MALRTLAAAAALASFEIFRAGRHTAADGSVVDFTQADLEQAVKGYDPKKHDAPLVLGHPKHDDPAYGWVEGLEMKGGTVYARARKIDAAFVESYRTGGHEKVSASWYRPESPNNPTPGKWYLRHVGFLGAMPPSVKGLEPASFGEGETAADLVEVDIKLTTAKKPPKAKAPKRDTLTFAESVECMTTLRAWIEKQFGPDAAEEALPQAQLDAAAKGAEADAEKPEGDETGAKPAPGAKKTPEVADHAEPTPRELAVARREKELEERELEASRKGYVSFVEGLVRQGRPMPIHRDEVVTLLEAVGAIAPDSVSFGEGDTRTPLVVLEQLLSRLPVQVDFAERGGGGGDDGDDPKTIAKAAETYQDEQRAKGNHISTSDAVRHVKGSR